MYQHKDEHQITEEVIRAGQQNPNGWIYIIEGAFGPNERVPPHGKGQAFTLHIQQRLPRVYPRAKLDRRFLEQAGIGEIRGLLKRAGIGIPEARKSDARTRVAHRPNTKRIHHAPKHAHGRDR